MNKNLGQYFTENIELQNKVYEFILNKPRIILEPSVGKGHLIHFINKKIPNIKFDLYEIDNSLKLIDDLHVIYSDFLYENICCKYTTIIGNPPYVKRKKKRNLYLDFIEKCFGLLENNGELIFIVPSDFFKLTSASLLLINMMNNGTFTHVYHPNNEKMFANASIDVCIFRYCKNINLQQKVLYNNVEKNIIINEGIITFQNKISNKYIDEYFHVGVGMVSGKEEVFKNSSYGNIELLNDENSYEKYIYIEEFPPENKELEKYLLINKEILINRKIRKFNENNWFEWGALRNKSLIDKNLNKECIYVRNLTRNNKIAFKGKVSYFGGKLIILIPKNNININNIVDYLNSTAFKCNYMYSGRFKIGQKQLCKSHI
jgi:adenine-specific DNA-methyltransferase